MKTVRDRSLIIFHRIVSAQLSTLTGEPLTDIHLTNYWGWVLNLSAGSLNNIIMTGCLIISSELREGYKVRKVNKY